MKRIIIPFFCIVLFSAPMAQQTTVAYFKIEAVKSQLSSKEVIDSYLKAIEEKDKLQAVKTTLPAEASMMTKKIGYVFESGYQLEQIKRRTNGRKV
jgi:hypothetical protein